jgi:hypothetical protein
MLVAGIVVNLLHLVGHSAWLTPMGTTITSAFGLVATVRVLEVFPFAFERGFDGAPVIRVLLVLGVVGSALGAVIAIVQLFRLHRLTRGSPTRRATVRQARATVGRRMPAWPCRGGTDHRPGRPRDRWAR